MGDVLRSTRWSHAEQLTPTGLGRESEVFKAAIVADESTRSSNRLGIDDLFSDAGAMPPEISQARGFLGKTVMHVDAALSSNNSGDAIAADDEILHAIASCDGAFALRRIGDGFAMIVQGCLSALEHMRGRPLDAKQLVAVKQLLRTASTEPYLTDDMAAAALEAVEATGACLEPEGADIIFDWLNG